MARRERKQLTTGLIMLLCLALFPALSLADDAGLVTSIELSHKFNKKLSAGIEAEFRSRNNFRTADRFSLGVDASYKVLPWLKAAAGYQLLIYNNQEEITFQDDGVSYNNWRPSYWGPRHRFNVSLTASYKVHRVELSLRERWQYTYRPSRTIDNFDFDEGLWEDHEVRGKGKNVLRSRIQLEWDIPRCKFDPFASVEFFNARDLEETRFIVGVDHSIKKKHNFKLYYRCQVSGSSSDPNMHMLGVGYTYKL